MSRTAKLIVFVTPAPGADETEFNRFFDEVHVPQIKERVPGFIRAERYKLSAAQVHSKDELPAHQYLNIWDVEADDLQDAADRLAKALNDGTLDGTSTVDVQAHSPLLYYYEPTS